jgi:hypothetical protein
MRSSFHVHAQAIRPREQTKRTKRSETKRKRETSPANYKARRTRKAGGRSSWLTTSTESPDLSVGHVFVQVPG